MCLIGRVWSGFVIVDHSGSVALATSRVTRTSRPLGRMLHNWLIFCEEMVVDHFGCNALSGLL